MRLARSIFLCSLFVGSVVYLCFPCFFALSCSFLCPWLLVSWLSLGSFGLVPRVVLFSCGELSRGLVVSWRSLSFCFGLVLSSSGFLFPVLLPLSSRVGPLLRSSFFLAFSFPLFRLLRWILLLSGVLGFGASSRCRSFGLSSFGSWSSGFSWVFPSFFAKVGSSP